MANLPIPSTEANVEHIQHCIYFIRGQRVILDRDLAELYHVETRILNQAVKRNQRRFPEDFVFQLTEDELEDLRSQIMTSRANDTSRSSSQNVILNNGRGHNVKYLPYAFTEHGVVMVASLLKSDIAVSVSVWITRAFVAMRQTIASLSQTELKIELLNEKVDKLNMYIEEVLHDQNEINEETTIQLELINQSLAELQAKPMDTPREPIGFR